MRNKPFRKFVYGWIIILQGIVMVLSLGLMWPDWGGQYIEHCLRKMFAEHAEKNKP